MKRLKIGLAGFFHNNARGDREVYDSVIKGMKKLERRYGFEFYSLDFPIYSNKDGVKAVEKLNSIDIDFVFMFCASVANGNAVIPFSQLNAKIGIWSVPENEVTGYLPLNSFCGSMVTAGILGTHLKEFKIKHKWFYGYPDSPQFQKRFDVTYRALSAIKHLESSKVGCIGEVVEGFDHLITDSAAIKKQLGLTVDRGMTVHQLVEMAEVIDGQSIQQEVKRLEQLGKREASISDIEMERFARLTLALKQYAKDNDYDALAISCWSRLQEIYNIAICGPVAILNEEGIIAACEADVDGAIGMMVESAMNEFLPVTMVDMVHLDYDKSSINLWHCGPSAPSLADEKGVSWDMHFDIGEQVDGEWQGRGCVSCLQYKPGNVTVSRLNTRSNNLLVFEGEMSEQEGYQGSSGWVSNLTMGQEKLEIDDLLTTLYKSHVDHHLTLGWGSNEDAWREFGYWRDVEILAKQTYKDYAF